MRLLSVLVLVVAILAVSNSAALVAEATDDTELRQTSSDHPIDIIDASHTETRPKSRFRGVNNADYDGENDLSTRKVFLEDRIMKKLVKKSTRQQLYKKWYNCGFTIEQVSAELAISSNSKLYPTYYHLRMGYQHYIRSRYEPIRVENPKTCTEDYLANIIESQDESSS